MKEPSITMIRRRVPLTLVGLTLLSLALAALVGGSVSSAAAPGEIPGRGFLPDDRGWEMVTPSSKNGADVLVDSTRSQAAAGGGAVMFSSLVSFGDVAGNPIAADYMGVRGPDGWAVHGITPTQEPLSFEETSAAGVGYRGTLSPDLSKGLYLAQSPLTDAPNVALAKNLYMRDDLLTPGAGSYQLLSDATTMQPVLSVQVYRPFDAGASADFSRVIFESRRNLTADAVSADLDPTVPKLYKWVNGTLRLEGILPSSEGGGPAASSQAGRGALKAQYTDRTISQDGSRVVFTGPPFDPDLPAAGRLYLRDDHGTPTVGDDESVRVNVSERTDCADDPIGCSGVPAPDPAGEQPAMFGSASADLSQVFFTTKEQLTDDDHSDSNTNDLYRYDLDAPAGQHLTRLGVNSEGSSANVAGVVGASEDGSHVYFVAHGQLIEGQPPDFGRWIYLWHAGTLTQVGKVNGNDELDQILGSTWGAPKWSRVTPDGKRMVFISQGTDGLTGYDHGSTCTAATTPECLEVYVFDAAANGGAGELGCASCNPSGATATADASFNSRFAQGGSSKRSYLNRAVTDDGRFVFFTSAERLVPEDVNGVEDAYEYDIASGQVHLISSGTDSSPSFFMDSSSDGSEVFFVTRERLVSSDDDQNGDLYVAKVGGGFAEPDAPAEPCVTVDGCRGVGSGAPEGVASSGGGSSGGNASPGVRGRLMLVGISRRARSRAVRSGVLTVGVRTSSPGLVKGRVRARLGGRSRPAGSGRVRARRGGLVTLRMKLSPEARGRLRSGRALRLRVAVEMAGSRSQTLVTVLERSGR